MNVSYYLEFTILLSVAHHTYPLTDVARSSSSPLSIWLPIYILAISFWWSKVSCFQTGSGLMLYGYVFIYTDSFPKGFAAANFVWLWDDPDNSDSNSPQQAQGWSSSPKSRQPWSVDPMSPVLSKVPVHGTQILSVWPVCSDLLIFLHWDGALNVTYHIWLIWGTALESNRARCKS